jgi:hypothetical protein
MTLLEKINLALAQWPRPREAANNSVIVPTHCLYPSNGVVEVQVFGGTDAFVVTDRGGAVDLLEMSGGESQPRVAKIVANLARRSGLTTDRNGTIVSGPVPLSSLIATIFLVANVSKDVSERLLAHFKPTIEQSFRSRLDQFMVSRYGDVRDKVVPGAAKSHRVDYLVPLGPERSLAVDAVLAEASSINAAIVTHLDLRAAASQTPSRRQRA